MTADFSPSEVDVAVVGGGPAGSTSARLLATWGHRVALLTRPAARPSLAESIPPSAGKLLDRTGWRAAMDEAGFIRSTGNTVTWDVTGGPRDTERAVRHAYYAEGARGYQVDRGVLNRVLLDGVAGSGVALVEDAIVTAWDGKTLRYQRRSEERDLSAHWLLDCSGRAGVVAKQRWRRAVSRLRTLAVAAVWQRAGAWPLDDASHTVVESHDRGWVWSVPLSSMQRQVTVMIDPRLTTVRTGAPLADLYHEELRRATGLWAMTRDASMLGEPFARDASPYTAHQVAGPGVLLVGDAASFVDPLSSFGIKKALASAWLAAVVVHTCLTEESMAREALALYESRERAMYDALERDRVALARDLGAATRDGGERSEFWIARAESDVARGGEPNEDVDIASLRGDTDVQRAFDELKHRDRIALARGSALELVEAPAIHDAEHRVVMERRLRVPAFPLGVRYVRNVDLVSLVELAPHASQVPDLYDIYCRRVVPVPLADFLGALSLLLGKGMLAFA